jgi:hypothetical protein
VEPWCIEIFGQRAYCPLYRDGAQGFYGERGFKLPEGLRRHLIGFGRTRQCVIVRATVELARDHWHEKFQPQEQQAAREKQALKEKRLASETVYLLAPGARPVLLDEGENIWRRARPTSNDSPGLAWAERRLAELGFQAVYDGRLRSYTKPVACGGRDFVVYADPRHAGAIHFAVFDPAARGQKRSKCWPRSRFRTAGRTIWARRSRLLLRRLLGRQRASESTACSRWR